MARAGIRVISQAVLDMLRARATIPELLSKLTNRTVKGSLAFCPFHDNTRTPAFYVCHEGRGFVCYGCSAKGDAIGFLRRVAKLRGIDLSWEMGVTVLARIFGVQLDDSPKTMLAVAEYLKTADSEPVTGRILREWARDRVEPTLCRLYRYDEWARSLGLLLDDRLEDLLFGDPEGLSVDEVQKGVNGLVLAGSAYLNLRDEAEDFFEQDA